MGCFQRETPTLNEDQKKILKEMELLATGMDSSLITICGKGIGYDGVIGLIPVVGDLFTSAISLWIVMRAWFAFDKWLFRRKWCIMLMNVAIDLLIGMIPLFGDIFDVFWKSNIKNVNIVRKHYGMPPLPKDGGEVPSEEEEAEPKGKRGRKSRTRGIDLEEQTED